MVPPAFPSRGAKHLPCGRTMRDTCGHCGGQAWSAACGSPQTLTSEPPTPETVSLNVAGGTLQGDWGLSGIPGSLQGVGEKVERRSRDRGVGWEPGNAGSFQKLEDQTRPPEGTSSRQHLHLHPSGSLWGQPEQGATRTRQTMSGRGVGTAVCRPGREAWARGHPADSLVWGVEPLEL